MLRPRRQNEPFVGQTRPTRWPVEEFKEYPIVRATIYVHSDKESNWELGEQLGLSDEAIRLFRHACLEVKIDLEVAQDGNATIVAVDDKPLHVKPFRKITVCTDQESLHQAIYVDGELKDSENSMYANEVATWIEDGEPVLIESVTCRLSANSYYPDNLSELEIVIED